MNKLVKLGQFFRVIDENSQLSITNVAVITTLVKLALIPQVGITEAGALLITLLNYSHKKRLNKDSSTKSNESTKDIEALKSKVSTLEIKNGINRL